MNKEARMRKRPPPAIVLTLKTENPVATSKKSEDNQNILLKEEMK